MNPKGFYFLGYIMWLYRRYFVFFLLATILAGANINSFAGTSQKLIGESSKKRMSRVALKKNIVDGVNMLTQEMLDRHGANTIFIIKHDYYLSGDITVPSNSELTFRGGSIRNGKVDFNGCKMISKRKALYNIRFSNIADLDVDIFDIPNDATSLLQDIVNSCSYIDLKNKVFGVSKVITINANKGEFKISNGTIYALPVFEKYEGEELTSTGTLVYMRGINNGLIYNITLDGKGIAQKGLFITRSNNLSINHCTIKDFDGTDKTMSWGIRCNNCSGINLHDSHVYNIVALPVGKVGGSVGSAAGVVFEHTFNSSITNNLIESVESTQDGDAIHISSVPNVNNAPAPSRSDLYEDVIVHITNNVIKGNNNSKRCIKIQANGVIIKENYIQKLYMNKTNVISIYGSNVELSNNTIESEESYTLGIGDKAIDNINNVVIRGNIINHNTNRDWGACIYMISSSMNNFIIDSNTVRITNGLNSFCDLRAGLNTFTVSTNKVTGGSHFFRVRNEINRAEINNLQIKGNEFEGDYDLLTIEKDKSVNTSYEDISVDNNTFEGGDASIKMVDIPNLPEIRKSIQIGANKSNKSIGL